MKLVKEKKTNPKIRLGLLRADERRIINSLKEKEKEIKIKLEELKAVRKLLAEVIDELEVEEYEETLKTEIEEEITKEKEISKSIDTLVGNVKTELGKTNEQTLYTGLKSDALAIAASENSISRLYELAYKSTSWTEDESKEFFTIQNAVVKVKDYNLSPNISKAVDTAYRALQVVSDQKGEDIKQNYKPQYALKLPEASSFDSSLDSFGSTSFSNSSNAPSRELLDKFNSFTPQNISDKYKSGKFEDKFTDHKSDLKLDSKKR